MSIYTVLNVPTATTHPSVTSLQWSDDGQLCLATKSAVYIFTPDHGISLSTPADASLSVDDAHSVKPLSWYRTMFDISRVPNKSWAELCDDWATISLGSLDVSIRMVACSPSGLSSHGRCILAVLTTDMHVTLWAATKNHLKGEWSMIADLTEYIFQLVSDPKQGANARILKAQISSITWSSQADFGVFPVPLVDASILSLGSRAGEVSLHRFCCFGEPGGGVSLIARLVVSESWITHLAWSPWVTTSTHHCMALLAYATADGGIGLLRVSQVLEAVSVIGFVPDYGLHVNIEPLTDRPFHPDKCGTTALQWISTLGQPVLVFTKAGLIHLWSPLSSLMHWHGLKSLMIETQRLSVGSSSLVAVSGLSYVLQQDALIVALSDGSLHAIHNLSSEPSWAPVSPIDSLTSEALSQASRTFFIRTSSPPGVDYSDLNRIGGLVSYDSQCTLSWVYEALRPSDFSYKHEAKHGCVLLTAPFWSLDDRTIWRLTQETLSNIHCASREVPLHRLRATFLHLCNMGHFVTLCPRLLEILDQPSTDDSYALGVSRPSWHTREELSLHLRNSFATHFFGWDGLLRLRINLCLADICWKLCKETQMQIRCGEVAKRQLAEISHRVLRIMVRHLRAIVTGLTGADVPFVLRVVVQSLLPGSPPDLSNEAQALSDEVNAVIAIDSTTAGLHELCPACHIEVPLKDITQATCQNGHTWARCSVTSFILSTSMVRTCIGCNRKALLPVSQSSSALEDSWLPVAARSWVVKELLEAVQRCLFCGNSFVEII